MQIKRFISMILLIFVLVSTLALASCGETGTNDPKVAELTEFFNKMYGYYNNEEFANYADYLPHMTDEEKKLMADTFTESTKNIKITYSVSDLTYTETEDGRTLVTFSLTAETTNLMDGANTKTTTVNTVQSLLSKTDAGWVIDQFRITFA